MSLAIHRAMAAVPHLSTPAVVVTDGDSNTYGYTGVTHGTEDWPAIMAGQLNGSSAVTNIAVSGYTIQQMIDHAAALADTEVVASAQFARGCPVRNLSIIMGGTNRGTGDLDAWEAWLKMRTYIAARRAAGFSHVIVMGILKSGTDPIVEGHRLGFQAYAERDADEGTLFHYANHDSVTELQDPTNGTNFFGDQTHIRPVAHAALGAFMADFVNDLTGVPA